MPTALRCLELSDAHGSRGILVLVAANDAECDDNAFLANKIQMCRRLHSGQASEKPLLAHEIQTEAAASVFIKYYMLPLDDQEQVLLETPGLSNLIPRKVFSLPFEGGEIPSGGKVLRSTNAVSYLTLGVWAQSSAEGNAARRLQGALDVFLGRSAHAGQAYLQPDRRSHDCFYA